MKNYQELNIAIDLENEEWKIIKNYSNYMVSNLGRIKSIRLSKFDFLLKQSNKDGYKVVKLKRKTFRVHRLVALTFLPNPKNKPSVNHINGNKKNNTLSNLEWCSYSENMFHAYKIGVKKPTTKQKVLATNLINNNIIIFDSCYEAARILGGQQSNIYNCCIGLRKTHKGYSFNFKN